MSAPLDYYGEKSSFQERKMAALLIKIAKRRLDPLRRLNRVNDYQIGIKSRTAEVSKKNFSLVRN